MDFSISDDDRLLQQSVRDFVEEQANAGVAGDRADRRAARTT